MAPMSARDEFPYEDEDELLRLPMSIRYERRREKYDAMCNTIDELRAQVAAVNDALDKYQQTNATGLLDHGRAIDCITAVAKAVGR